MNRWDSGCKQGSRDWERPDFQPGAARFRGDGQATWLLAKGGGSLPGLQKQAPSSNGGQLFKGWMPQGESAWKLLPPAKLPPLGRGICPRSE